MVARKHYGGLVFVLAVCLGTVFVFTRVPSKQPVEMFSQADLNIIDTAENMDATPQVKTQTAEQEQPDVFHIYFHS